jgi:hypothetical protein
MSPHFLYVRNEINMRWGPGLKQPFKNYSEKCCVVVRDNSKNGVDKLLLLVDRSLFCRSTSQPGKDR